MLGGGTAVVIQGPRFSTTAESVSFRAMGWDLVNMVSYPESHLARELAGKMPRGKVEVFDGVGHLIHLEAPQRFNESVLHFLNDGR